MASAFKEAVNNILNFDPGITVVEGQGLNLGRVDGYEVRYGNYVVQDRLVRAAGQPLLFGWRTRPTVALDRIDGNEIPETRTLAYKVDVKRLDYAVVWQVSQRLKEWHKSRQE